MSSFTRYGLSAISVMLTIAALAVPGAAAPSILIKNNLDMPYNGPVKFRTSLSDGYYAAKEASCTIKNGIALANTRLPAHSQLLLSKSSRPGVAVSRAFAITPDGGSFKMGLSETGIGRLDFSFVVIPGRAASADDVMASFKPLDISFARQSDGSFSGKAQANGYDVNITAHPIGGRWLDVSAEVVNTSAPADAAYIALVRRITAPGASDFRMRWNSQIINGAQEPAEYPGHYNLAHCMEWCSWKLSGISAEVVNGFTPGFTVETEKGRWVTANQYYIWEHMRKQNDALYFISEIAGPDPKLNKDYKGIRTYTPSLKGEPIKLHWQLAVNPSPSPDWEESQFLAYAGYRRVKTSGDKAVVDIGVPYVEFGTSYFPYSTMCENFDYYRVSGIDREGWWPFSPAMWENWRAYVPQMRTDLRIIRAMGFEWVRMHHLELVGEMDRKNALDFIDFYMNECRQLGLKVLVDTAGSTQWMSTLAGKYKDVVKRVEIENEILIPGIKPGDAERWAACYLAAKQAAPNTDVFLTGCCNLGTFDRLTRLGVPYDRLGYHMYKHGPGVYEIMQSAAIAVAGSAVDRGTTPVLSEFNWKMLTRHSPELRAKEWMEVFSNLLKPRAVPELLQFHWQETMSVNPRTGRQGIRHYETIYLDRRPKPEAMELMKLIRTYSNPDNPYKAVPISITETSFKDAKVSARFTIRNATAKPLSLKLSAECFGDAQCRLITGRAITLKPGKQAQGTIQVALKPNARPGVYHFFLRADYAGGSAYGWSWASNYGKPEFDPKPILADQVEYPQGLYVANSFDWSRPACVAFGPDAPNVEMEMAYMLANTLQSTTGRKIRLCSTADIPANMLENANLILVGTPTKNPLVSNLSLSLPAGKGVVTLQKSDNGRQVLVFSGDKSDAVEAAATDFVLRYWKNAKDSAIRISGMEPGAALGNKAAPGEINPP